MLQLKKTLERDYTKGNTKHKKYLAEKKEKKMPQYKFKDKSDNLFLSCIVMVKRRYY